MRLVILVKGRPAPQGSKEQGSAGQLLESSAYLPAWRQAVRIGTFEAYRERGIDPRALPLFAAGVPVEIEVCTFRMIRGVQCGGGDGSAPVGKPDVDKLLRSTLDALGGAGAGKSARLFADDSQVTEIRNLTKVWGVPGVDGLEPGATIIVSDGRD